MRVSLAEESVANISELTLGIDNYLNVLKKVLKIKILLFIHYVA